MLTTTLATDNDDVLRRWGLHMLDGGGGFGDPGNNATSATNSYPVHSGSGIIESGNHNTSYTYNYPVETSEPHVINLSPADERYNIVNDEAIAHAFQEELSKLPDTVESAVDTSKAAVLNQNWPNEETSYSSEPWRENEGQSSYGATDGNLQGVLTADFQSLHVEDEDSMGPPRRGSGSSSDSKGKGSSSKSRNRDSQPDYEVYQHGDDDENFQLALALSTQDLHVDREVAKRLTKLDSIRHIPRVNADELPTYDDASLDHARLVERLVMYGLNERQIQGDGNCQFRALSDQLYRTPEHHKFVRKTIVQQLKANPDAYDGYVTMPYSEYLRKLAKSGEWGDHVTLQAAADYYGVKIWLITSFKDTSFIEILPDIVKSNRVIYLSFWAEVHYNSIYPDGAEASSGILHAPKKKHWLLW